MIFESKKEKERKRQLHERRIESVVHMNSTIYSRVLDYCIAMNTTIYDLECNCSIPAGTIDTWKSQKPNPKHVFKIALGMNVSPFWLTSGKNIEVCTLQEEFILYGIRCLSKGHKDKIINNITHIMYQK